MTDDEYTEWDAAYVLNALSVSERHQYEQHLPGCGSCRRAVSELAPIPALLVAAPAPGPSTKTTASATASAPAAAADPPDPTERVHHGRRRGRMLLAAAAVGLVLVGGAAGYAVTESLSSPATTAAAGESVRLDPVADSGVHADLMLAAKPWGSRLEWSCSYPYAVDPGHAYELAVIDDGGARTVIATWTGDGRPRTTGLAASTSTPPDEIARIELSTASSGVLLAFANL